MLKSIRKKYNVNNWLDSQFLLLWRNWIACDPPKIKEQVRVLSAVPKKKETKMNLKFRKNFKIPSKIKMCFLNKVTNISKLKKLQIIKSSYLPKPQLQNINLDKEDLSDSKLWNILFFFMLTAFLIRAFISNF